MKTLPLKMLVLLPALLLIPLLCFADIVVYKGRSKALGYDILGPGVGTYFKANSTIYLLLEIDPLSGAISEGYAVIHDNTFGYTSQIFNVETVYDPTTNSIGIFSGDLYNEGLITAGSRFMASGKVKNMKVGNGVTIALGGNLKGVLIDILAGEINQQSFVMNFDRKFTRTANEIYFGNMLDSVTALENYLSDRGVVFP